MVVCIFRERMRERFRERNIRERRLVRKRGGRKEVNGDDWRVWVEKGYDYKKKGDCDVCLWIIFLWSV